MVVKMILSVLFTKDYSAFNFWKCKKKVLTDPGAYAIIQGSAKKKKEAILVSGDEYNVYSRGKT